jgi:hypothetical protein
MTAHSHFRFALGQSPAGVFYDGKGLGQDPVQSGGQFLFILNWRATGQNFLTSRSFLDPKIVFKSPIMTICENSR